MINKIVGYILGGIGILGLVLTIEQINTIVKIPPAITPQIITIVSVILIAVGVILIFKTSNTTKQAEVPIYEGKQIVGYRKV